MTSEQERERYEQEVHHALQHLYDPTELRKNQLLGMLGIEGGPSPLTRLRRTLADAVEALRPEKQVPLDAPAWRVYNILIYRYVEQLGQREVAADLCLSVRQLRRDEYAAIRLLTDQLLHRHEVRTDESAPDESAVAPPPSSTGRNGELEWLRQTLPSEMVDVRSVVESALSTAGPLTKAIGVDVSFEGPRDLGPVRGQLATVRQALLNVLSAVVPAVERGRIELRAEAGEGEITLLISGWRRDGSAVPIDQAMNDNFAISRQLIELGGGSLRMGGLSGANVVALSLPTVLTESIPVLVLDDNADTLQLFHRYVAGTRFELVSVSEPKELLVTAAALQPEAIILDVMLPEIDGWELLGQLREHPDTRTIPVIICTILPQEKLAMALGAAGFLQKPFTRESLFGALAGLTQPGTCPDL
jgi:CheY-like chemotaxis protein